MDWKKKALADFELWINDLPDKSPAIDGMAVDTCDLFTLLSEFTALRQEIRMQNRQQHKTLNVLDLMRDEYEKTSTSIKDFLKNGVAFSEETREILGEMKRTEVLAQRGLDDTLRREIEKQTALPFLDMRDALVRGKEAAQRVAERKGVFGRTRKMDGVIEGYEMAIRRLDRAFHAIGVRPLETVGRPFDPSCMRAVGKATVADTEKGIVIQERICGFVRGDEVIRVAEVVVTD